jgi:hypothetical protein
MANISSIVQATKDANSILASAPHDRDDRQPYLLAIIAAALIEIGDQLAIGNKAAANR